MLSTDEKFEYEISNIGPGWHKIARILHKSILEICPDYELVQIKSKLGAMRYYIDHSKIDSEVNKEINILISMCEINSHTICENCGNFKEPEIKSYNTLCKECA